MYAIQIKHLELKNNVFIHVTYYMRVWHNTYVSVCINKLNLVEPVTDLAVRNVFFFRQEKVSQHF